MRLKESRLRNSGRKRRRRPRPFKSKRICSRKSSDSLRRSGREKSWLKKPRRRPLSLLSKRPPRWLSRRQQSSPASSFSSNWRKMSTKKLGLNRSKKKKKNATSILKRSSGLPKKSSSKRRSSRSRKKLRLNRRRLTTRSEPKSGLSRRSKTKSSEMPKKRLSERGTREMP